MKVDASRLNWGGQHGTTVTMASSDATGNMPLVHANTPPQPERPALPEEFSVAYESAIDVREVDDWAKQQQRRQQALKDWHVQMNSYAAAWTTPVFMMTWTRLQPGGPGHCVLRTRNQRIPITVKARHAGRPLNGGCVYADGAAVATAEDGSAQVLGWAGTELSMNVTKLPCNEPQHDIITSLKVLVEAGKSVPVNVQAHQANPPTTTAQLDEYIAVTQSNEVDALQTALARDDLSPAAREQLQFWLRGGQQLLESLKRERASR